MTKILIDRATAEQALEALKEFGYHGSSPRWERAVNDLRTALEQPPLPVQEPTPWRDMVVVTLAREGINKHKARELADHFAAQPVQEPVGEVVEVNNDGFKCEFSQLLAIGTKLYTTPPAAQRPWVGLTEDEKFEMAAAQYGWEDLLIAAEAKLKELNK